MQTIVLYFAFFMTELVVAGLIQRSYSKKQYYGIYHRRHSYYINWRLLILEIILYTLYIFIFAARNYMVGTDTRPYYNMYNFITGNNLLAYNVSVNGLEYTYELFYSIVVNLAKILFNSFQGFLGLMAFIQFACFLSFCRNSIKEYEIKFNDILFVYFMLMFAPSFNIMRQTVAVCIVFLGMRYLYQRNLKLYCICVIAASLFHVSAIFTIFFYFIYDMEGRYSQVKEVFLVITCFFSPLLYSWLMTLLSSLSFMQKYTYLYTRSDITTGHIHFAVLNILLRTPIILLLFLYHKPLTRLNKKNRFLFVMYMFEISCFVLSIWYHWIFRMVYYGMCADFILVPEIIKINNTKIINNKRISILRPLIICYFIVFFFLTTVQRKYDGIIPYIFN